VSADNLTDLNNDELIDLGAQLERAISEIQSELLKLADAPEARIRLVKPGVKLGINAGVGVAGLALAPLSFGLSLGVAVIGIGMTLWDGIEFGRDVTQLIQMRRHIRRLRGQVLEAERQLRDIEALLTQRLGPP
jgi:hypothetical protein